MGNAQEMIRHNNREFRKFLQAIKKGIRQIDDLSVPLNTIADRFLESRKFIVDVKRAGPGLYTDLTEKYKRRKRKVVPIYPILYLTGALKASITKRGAAGNIVEVSKKQLAIGSSLKYAAAHNEGYAKGGLPKRPFLFWGPESPRHASLGLTKQLHINMALILYQFIERRMGKTMEASVDAARRKVTELFK